MNHRSPLVQASSTRLSASWIPLFAPRAPNGDTWCAASPANSTRPCTKAVHPPALERVHAHPLELERAAVTEHCANPRVHALRFLLVVRIGCPIPAESRCARGRRPAGAAAPSRRHETAGRTRTSARLGKSAFHSNVGDQEAIAEHLALPREAERVAHRAACAVAAISILRFDRIATIRSVDLEYRDVSAGSLLDRRSPCFSSALWSRSDASALDQDLFEQILLQIDERRPLVSAFRQKVELIRKLRRHRKPFRPSSHTPRSQTCIAASEPIAESRAFAWTQQIAREPALTVLLSSSTMKATPCCARSIAHASPTGPAPTIATWVRAAPPVAAPPA